MASAIPMRPLAAGAASDAEHERSEFFRNSRQRSTEEGCFSGLQDTVMEGLDGDRLYLWRKDVGNRKTKAFIIAGVVISIPLIIALCVAVAFAVRNAGAGSSSTLNNFGNGLRSDQGPQKQDYGIPNPVFNFAVIGDWGRRGMYNQKEVADVMGAVCEKRNCSFVVSTGDNFYDWGVDSTDDKQWRSSFREVYTADSLMVRWYSILGNHDYLGMADAQVDKTKEGGRWFMPDRYYGVRMSVDAIGKSQPFSLNMYFLDTNPFVEDYRTRQGYWGDTDILLQDTNAQLAWLDARLSENRSDWTIVVGHHPIRSYGPHGDQPELQRFIDPLLRMHKVHAYFNGHDHNMEHIKTPGSPHYITSGAGSATYPLSRVSAPDMLYGSADSSFVWVAMNHTHMDLEVFSWDGASQYKASIPQNFWASEPSNSRP
eukprot:tig00020927_g15990.t1